MARWYRELQHYGFIVKHREGYLGVDGRACAPRWRLTELGYMHEPPTKDYLRWNGRPFEDRKTDSRTGQSKTKSRDSNDARGVPQKEHGNVLQNEAL